METTGKLIELCQAALFCSFGWTRFNLRKVPVPVPFSTFLNPTILTSWWFQPIPSEKYADRQIGSISPKDRGENSKNI